MKKSSKTKSAQKSRKPKSAHAAEKVEPNRRDVLRKLRNGAIGLGLVGGAGAIIANMVSNTTHAHDLTRVANGRPTIVQVHDPNCSLCVSLQRETKRALNRFDDGQLDYVIANIKSAKGRAFANRYGVQHVTLLLFDGDGELEAILEGERRQHELHRAFEQLVSG